ncbi:MAG TPA: leucyl aminopeptidase [Candidatus Megaira endosymbiont of Nemacystus decipiens]|nr:leucyl aminopeptidase [Candidatus Megaera endosymbiont of Nemacystus decipiens]
MLDISFDASDVYLNDVIVMFVNDQLKFDQTILDVDQRFNNVITRSIKSFSKFKGKFAEVTSFDVLDQNSDPKKIIVISSGDDSNILEYQIEELGGKIYSAVSSLKSEGIAIITPNSIGKFNQDEVAALVGSGAILASYKFDKYQTKKEEDNITINKILISGNFSDQARKLFEKKKAIASGVFYARDLVSEVPNVLYPETYAESIVKEFESLEIDVEVLGEREMQTLGMGALLGVGQGSARESKMVVMSYKGSDNSEDKPLCFVGKGVTFDTGGISLKPALNMDAMKYDMGGSAAVVGLMKALAMRVAKVNAVGVVGLVENMPGSNAQRPGDVVKTMSGKTVEVLNTDAEGRLVLCDCVTYLQKNYNPECVIDLATLTGAIVISLASTYGGLFCNDEDLSEKLLNSSIASNEKLWRMPLHKDYDDMLKSSVADVANISTVGRGGAAGSSTAAHFIQRFIDDGIKWAHLDIAGVAWESTGKNMICPKGGVGFGVRLLNQFVQDYYEPK